jgi:hypothetical protein
MTLEMPMMSTKPRTVVGDLANWDLPLLDARMDELIHQLQKRKLHIVLDADTLGEQLYEQLWERVRELGATAANEAITGWMQGVADGCPDVCVEFPYLEDDASSAPLTVTYSVGAEDGSRLELQRIDLGDKFLDAVQFGCRSDAELAVRHARAKALSHCLRTVADRIDGVLK